MQDPYTDFRSGQFVASPGERAERSEELLPEGQGFSATYAAADVALVVNQVLGGFLGLNYTIAPDVSGQVTMRMTDLRSRAQALDALRAALDPLGILVVERGDFVAIVRGAGDGVAGGIAVLEPGEPAPAGTGAAVVTPRFVAPSELAALAAPFAMPGTVALADDERRLLVLRGEEAAITAASEAIALFDVDWFAQVSTGIFPLTHITPGELARELAPLLGPAAEEVELVPAPRLSSLIVLARSPDALRAVKAWVERLDVAPVRAAMAGLLIYDPRYSDAETLAASISSLMGGAGYVPPPSVESESLGDMSRSGGNGLFPSLGGASGPGGFSGPGGLPDAGDFSTSASGSLSRVGGFGGGGGLGGAQSGVGQRAASGMLARRTTASPPAVPVQAAGGAPGSDTGRGLIITAVKDQNAVIARGEDAELAEVRTLLESLDRPRAQVLIEATIIEVSLTDELRYGVNWAGMEDGRLEAIFSDAADGAVVSRFPGFSVSYVNVDVSAAINLLSSVTKVDVVSRPSVIALNNEMAALQIGDQVPIVTQSAISVIDTDAPIVNQTTYRDTGVILSVIPHIRAGGYVDIEIAQEVSDVARTTTSGIDSPTISQRRIESRLVVPSGGSVALGGLISSTRTKGRSGVPVLKSIPLFGRLFRNETQAVDRTELIVFLTPRVLATPDEAVDATKAMRAAMSRLEAVLADP